MHRPIQLVLFKKLVSSKFKHVHTSSVHRMSILVLCSFFPKQKHKKQKLKIIVTCTNWNISHSIRPLCFLFLIQVRQIVHFHWKVRKREKQIQTQRNTIQPTKYCCEFLFTLVFTIHPWNPWTSFCEPRQPCTSSNQMLQFQQPCHPCLGSTVDKSLAISELHW